MSVAERIKALRAQTGMTQSQFAAYLGLSIRSLQNWESGHRDPPDHTLVWLERLLIAEKKIPKPTTPKKTRKKKSNETDI